MTKSQRFYIDLNKAANCRDEQNVCFLSMKRNARNALQESKHKVSNMRNVDFIDSFNGANIKIFQKTE